MGLLPAFTVPIIAPLHRHKPHITRTRPCSHPPPQTLCTASKPDPQTQAIITTFQTSIRTLHKQLLSPTPPPNATLTPILQTFHTKISTTLSPSTPLPATSHLLHTITLSTTPTTPPTTLARRISPHGPLRHYIHAALRQSGLTPSPRRTRKRTSGTARQRNPNFHSLPYRAFREHPGVISLPSAGGVELTDVEQLGALRRDEEPFRAVRGTLPVLAEDVWTVLGFGERGMWERLDGLLPGWARGHGHVLRVWRRMYRVFRGGEGGVEEGFWERWRIAHVPDGMLVYLEGERRWMERCGWGMGVGVKVREIGVLVRRVEGVVVAGAPVGMVGRRVKEDFWMWGAEDGIVVFVCEEGFRERGDGRYEFYEGGFGEGGKNVGVLSFLEAVLGMFCADEQMVYADVVKFAVLGGAEVWRVWRDDDIVRAVVGVVTEFCQRFLGERARPPAEGFQNGLDGAEKVLEMVLEGCATAVCRYQVSAEECEGWLERWRSNISVWESRISERPFYGGSPFPTVRHQQNHNISHPDTAEEEE